MKILILGGGPAGLGAAHRLTEAGHEDWVLVDQVPELGGLASSVTRGGYTWDHGVHVLHSHYDYFDRVMADLVGVELGGDLGPFEWIEQERAAWAVIPSPTGAEQWVPYPVQENFRHLCPEQVLACVRGLLSQHSRAHFFESVGNGSEPVNFQEWILESFGHGLADVFMTPYNKKVWGCDPSAMNTAWVGDRVARVDLGRVLENLIMRRDRTTWGPNATFKYPKRGGTGSIWRAVGAGLSQERVKLGVRVTHWDAVNKWVDVYRGGQCERLTYDAVVSTLPLNNLPFLTTLDEPTLPGLTSDLLGPGVDKLVAQTTHVVGVGFRGDLPEDLVGKSWVYLPGKQVFYRASVLSNFSANMTPARRWSILCEVGDEQARTAEDGVVMSVLADLEQLGLGDDRMVDDVHYQRLDRGYPVPTLERDEILARVMPLLRERHIWSVGRFGGWVYERSNMDDSFVAGVHAVNEILGVQSPMVRR